jgi:hypothetical protein
MWLRFQCFSRNTHVGLSETQKLARNQYITFLDSKYLQFLFSYFKSTISFEYVKQRKATNAIIFFFSCHSSIILRIV